MSLTPEQVQTLLKPINPSRVLKDNNGMSHVSQQDIRAHLTRIFGFGGWSTEVRSLDLVAEDQVKNSNNRDAWAITYRALVRLTIRDPHGNVVASYDEVGTGTSPKLPQRGDAHDFACKVAVSIALKRAATNLGDGFGLSLYNKGQVEPLVIGTLVMPNGDGVDASDDVPEQVTLGNDDSGSTEWPDVAQPGSGPAPVQDKRDPKWLDAWIFATEKADSIAVLRGQWGAMGEALRMGKVTDADATAAREVFDRRTAILSEQVPA